MAIKTIMLGVLLIFSFFIISTGYAKEMQQESDWYYGFGIGGGANAKFTISGADTTFNEWLKGADPINSLITMNFKVGRKLNRMFWLGFDGTLASQTGKFGNVDALIQISNYFAMLAYFPNEKGFFLRGGAGFANLQQQWVSGNTTLTAQKNGYGFLGGFGYAFPVKDNFNLTLNVDYTKQTYPAGSDNLTASQFGMIYMGFDWY